MRLIDADALTTEILGMRYTEEAPSVILTQAGQEIFNSGIETANFAVHDAPTIDAVPVVRCKDCKHWRSCAGATEHVKCCEFAGYMVGENGYCVYGEKSEEDTDETD